MTEEAAPLLPPGRVVSRYARRWDMLVLLSVLGLLHNIIWNTWGPLVQTTSKLYNWDRSTIALYANINSIMFIIMCVPSAFIIRKSLKTALLLASGAMALGTCLRAAFLSDPEGSPQQFTIFCNICAVLNGISSPLIGCGTMLLAFLWFPQEELGTALTISQIFYNLGPGLPFLMAKQMVQPMDNITNTTMPSNSDLNNDMQWYLYSQAIPAALFFIFIVIYFPSGPSRPSRRDLGDKAREFFEVMQRLVIKKTSWLIALGSAIPQGIMRVWLAMVVYDFQAICFGPEFGCIAQSWINTLAIFASVGSTVAGIAAVRIINLSNRHLKITVCVLYSLAIVDFLYLTLVSLGIVHSASAVKAHISIFFLTVTGYSLITSSLPLTLKLAMNIMSPASDMSHVKHSEITVAMWLNFWLNLISIIFLTMLSISGLPTIWLHFILPLASLAGLSLLLPLRVHTE